MILVLHDFDRFGPFGGMEIDMAEETHILGGDFASVYFVYDLGVGGAVGEDHPEFLTIGDSDVLVIPGLGSGSFAGGFLQRVFEDFLLYFLGEPGRMVIAEDAFDGHDGEGAHGHDDTQCLDLARAAVIIGE